jgi:hypothetical protein
MIPPLIDQNITGDALRPTNRRLEAIACTKVSPTSECTFNTICLPYL